MVLRNEAISFERPRKTAERLGVTEQVDIALAVALFLVGQTVPLFGRGQQALGQKGQFFGEDGQLAGLGMAKAAVDTDQVAQVELVDQAPAEVAHLLLAHEDLDVVGPVAEVEEDDLALPAPEHDPPGDTHRRARLVVARRPEPARKPAARTAEIAWCPSNRCPHGSTPRLAIRSSFSMRTSSRLSRGSSAIVPLTSFRFITSGKLDPNCSVPPGPVNGNHWPGPSRLPVGRLTK